MPVATCSIDLLQFRASVTGPASLLAGLLALFPWADPPDGVSAGASHACIDVESDAPRSGWYRVTRDGTPYLTIGDRDDPLAALEWAICTTAVEHLGSSYLLLHAGAVADGGQGMLLSAASGGGKTTLVAGLLASGLQFLSDEVAAVDLETGLLRPFPRSLCIKPGARRMLTRLYPRLARDVPRRRFDGSAVWYLPPSDEARPREPVAIRYVVFPRYHRGARTTLAPISRTAALAHLSAQSFNLQLHGARGIGGLVDILGDADCFVLTAGALRPALTVLRRIIAGSGRPVGAVPDSPRLSLG